MITPHEAMQRLKLQDPITIEGVTYELDGPMMSPPEYWSPFAYKGDEMYYTPGEPGDEITPETEWVKA